MTPSIDYNHIHSTVETELTALQAERAELQEQQKRVEQRLVEINLHEEKLQRVFDSLTDLLGANNLSRTDLFRSVAEAIDSANGESKAENSSESATAAEPELTAGAAETPVETPTPEATLTANSSTAVSVSATEAASAPVIALPSEESILVQAETSPTEENDLAPTTVSVEAAPVDSTDMAPATNSNNARPTEISDFNPADFFERFPHIQRTHPVNVLARKLLEYFERGLKLGEIARLIEALGYQHSSRNFTDTVHSALKNKRKTTGEFRFNAKKAVWELSHWPTPDDANPAETRTAPQTAETINNRSKANAVDNQPANRDEKNGKPRKTGRGDASSLASKKQVSRNGISVYKRVS